MGFAADTRFWAGRTAQELSLKQAEQVQPEGIQVVRVWESEASKATEDDEGAYVQAHCVCSALEAPLIALKYADAKGTEYELQLTPDTLVVTDKAAVPVGDLKPKQVLKAAHDVQSAFTVVSTNRLPDAQTYTLHLQGETPTAWLDLQHLVIQN